MSHQEGIYIAHQGQPQPSPHQTLRVPPRVYLWVREREGWQTGLQQEGPGMSLSAECEHQGQGTRPLRGPTALLFRPPAPPWPIPWRWVETPLSPGQQQSLRVNGRTSGRGGRGATIQPLHLWASSRTPRPLDSWGCRMPQRDPVGKAPGRGPTSDTCLRGPRPSQKKRW